MAPHCSTHRALNNIDILLEILDCLDPYEYEVDDLRERSRALARLARVCRIFLDPALDALCSEQDGFGAALALISLSPYYQEVS